MTSSGTAGTSFLRRTSGPLRSEVLRLRPGARNRFTAYARDHGWTEADWFDLPGASAWRREPPGIWEIVWQDGGTGGGMLDVRLTPPEHPPVWQRQVIAVMRGLAVAIGHDMILTDERGVALVRFDGTDGRAWPVAQGGTAPSPPSFALCCSSMAAQFEPRGGHVVAYRPDTGEFGLPVPAERGAYVTIGHCPWCGAGVSRDARRSSSG